MVIPTRYIKDLQKATRGKGDDVGGFQDLYAHPNSVRIIIPFCRLMCETVSSNVFMEVGEMVARPPDVESNTSRVSSNHFHVILPSC